MIKRYLLIGLIVGSIAVALHSYAYGRFIVTPYEFLKLNVLQNVSSCYGTQPWRWYFTVGLPTILGPFTIPFLIAIVQTLQNRRIYADRFNLLIATLFTLVVYSCIKHKEFRFVLPLLPISLHITANAPKNWSRNGSRLLIWIVALSLLVFNAIPAVYLSWIHQRGTTDIMRPIERIAREYRDSDGHRAKFLFLMPCHSTPFYSHVHQNVTLRFLTCAPNFNDEENYTDEADQFYANPAAWIRSHVPVYPKTAMPTHTILFDSLQPQITEFLKSYKLVETINHSEYTDRRVGHHVLLYERVSDELLKKPTDEPNPFNPPGNLDSSTSTNRDEF